MSSFQDVRGFSFTITLRQKLIGVLAQAVLNYMTELCGTPLGFCLRVIGNEKPLNIEKTISGVLSVLLLVYDYFNLEISITKFLDVENV